MKKINKLGIALGKNCGGLSCKFCFVHTAPEKYNFEKYFTEIKGQVKKHSPRMVLINENYRSDPFSEKCLPELFDYLNGRGHVKKISIITNGMFRLPDKFKGCKKLQIGISIDGPKHSHEFNRGKGTFDVAWKFFEDCASSGIKSFVRVIASKGVIGDPGFDKFITDIKAHGNAHIYFQALIPDASPEHATVSEINKALKGHGMKYDPAKHLEHFPMNCVFPRETINCFQRRERCNVIIGGCCGFCNWHHLEQIKCKYKYEAA